MKQRNVLWLGAFMEFFLKQYNIPWLGAFMESFFVTLPMLSVFSFWAIFTVLYANIRPYLLQHIPWLTFWIFMVAIVVIGLIGMVVVYKFIILSIWLFRKKQMSDFEKQMLDRMDVLETTLKSITSNKKDNGV